MTLERRPEERALDRLISELREQSPAELDWQRVEARLLAEPTPKPANASSFHRLRWPAAGLVAVAATIALIAQRAHTNLVARVPTPVARVASGPLNGDRLALGVHVTAGNQPLVVEHAGRARWTLEPHATALVADAGEYLTVRLESGAISAQVVPNPKLETFAVEVGGTRVAVHGTAFRVERDDDGVRVAVSEGTVAVEPVGTRAAPAFLLRRDSRGSFAFDGRTGSVEGNASVVSVTAEQSHREVAPSASSVVPRSPAPLTRTLPALPTPALSAHDATSAPALPLQPSISDIETGVSAALELMNGCFRDKTKSTGIHVSASTGVTISVTGDGAVRSATFAPPLAPAVEDCAVSGMRNLSFARSLEGVTFTRVFELSR